MKFLYHENISNGTTEETIGHTENMERQGPNACLDKKNGS
jgi:hypothetical protein